MTGDPADSFARWQTIALRQLASARNLILAFGIAGIGFDVTLLMNVQVDATDHWQIVAYLLFLLSLLLLVVSTALGIWAIVMGLREIRARMHVARAAEQALEDRQTLRRRTLAERLEARHWRVLWWQIAVFGGGIFITVAGASLMALRWLITGDMPESGCNV